MSHLLKRKSIYETKHALQLQVDELKKYYKPIELNQADFANKKIALQMLEKILKTRREFVQSVEFEELIFCSLTLLFYFGMRLQSKSLMTWYWSWRDKRSFVKAETAFKKILECLLPERGDTAIRVTLQFLREVNLWPVESCVVAILDNVMLFLKDDTILFNILLSDLHSELSINISQARHRMRVLYELLQSENWIITTEKLLPFVSRLFNFFRNSAEKEVAEPTHRYLRRGFEVCLRRVFERIENFQRLMIIRNILSLFTMAQISDTVLLQFSSLLLYAAELFQVELYTESLSDGLIDNILTEFVGSDSHVYNAVGLRLILRLLDRHHNAPYLTVPTLYYEFSQVHLTVGDSSVIDKEFIRKHREKLHEHILNVVTQHGWSSGNLKAMYSVICCMVLEVPCGFTAAAATCMMMAIQDFALNTDDIPANCRYWMHAIVISVMSLICWAHKAPFLYRYVNQIISRRMKEAPQLNPPMKKHYEIKHSHVTWNKPTLFFEDWELRYGLWKQFQVTPKKRPSRAKLVMEKNRKVSKIKSSKLLLTS